MTRRPPGRRRALGALGNVLGAVLAMQAGCGSCGGDDRVAELRRTNGDVRRDALGAIGTWTPAQPGAAFRFGEAVRTGPDATALCDLRGGSRARLEPATLVRFLEAPPGEESARLQLESGEAWIETSDSEALLADLVVGLARIERSSRVRLSVDEDGAVRLEVELGLAQLERPGEAPIRVAEDDDTLRLDPAGSLAEEAPEPPPAVEPEPDPTTPPPTSARVESGDGDFREGADGAWTPLGREDRPLGAGTEVRAARRAVVRIQRGQDVVLLQGGAQARVGTPDGPLVELTRGDARATSTTRDVVVDVPGGAIVLRGGAGGSEADVAVGRRSTETEVRRGTVDVRGDEGDTTTLAAGQRASLRRTGAVAAPDPPPARVHLVIPMGESATIHDAVGAPAVGVTLDGACPAGGVVELGDATSAGAAQANVRLRGASNPYRVRCLVGGALSDEEAASGTLRWSRSSGAARLPRRPARNVLDADGLRYTVLYQTLLPELVMRWREASGSAPFTLVVTGTVDARERGARATHTFASGALPEGRYAFHFEAADGARSPESSLVIRFDNAAEAAYVREPSPRARVRGPTVRVSGAALAGARVTVGAVVLPLDAQRRFNGEVPVPVDQDAVAIRIEHPRTGLHYYLRRVARAAPSP